MDSNECEMFSDQRNLALISLSDVRPVLIPPFSIQQAAGTSASTTQAVNTLTQSFERNSIKQINIEISNSNEANEGEKSFKEDNLGINWSNSLFRPALDLGNPKRRECKSSSEETFINEIDALSFKSGPKFANRPVNKLTHRGSAEFISTTLETNRLNGKFGYNPMNIHKQNVSRFNQLIEANSMKNTRISSCLKNKINREKRPKRLKSKNDAHSMVLMSHSMRKDKSDTNHNKKLFHLVQNNEYLQLKDLLDTNMYDVNCCDDKQRTCLHIASSRGHLEIVRLLLDYGANPNIRDCVNNFPIHLAIISSHVPIVTLLLEAGTDIHALDLNGKTVLHLAGTRLRWLLNDDNNKASPKLKLEAIMIMDMIKQYLRRKQAPVTDLNFLANRLENVINLEDMSGLDDLLNQFDTFNIKPST